MNEIAETVRKSQSEIIEIASNNTVVLAGYAATSKRFAAWRSRTR